MSHIPPLAMLVSPLLFCCTPIQIVDSLAKWCTRWDGNTKYRLDSLYNAVFAANVEHYVFQGTLFQHRFLVQQDVTKIWSVHLTPINLPAIVEIVQYRVSLV